MLVSLTPLIGCGLMMIVCVAVMARPGDRRRRNDANADATSAEAAALREEVDRLRRLVDQQVPPVAAEDPAP